MVGDGLLSQRPATQRTQVTQVSRNKIQRYREL